MIFKDNGNLRIPITEVPVNEADQKATYMIATGIIPEDGTIRGDLYDAKDKLVAKRRVYRYKGEKNAPFAEVATDKESYLDGETPTESWTVDTIKLWLDDRAELEIVEDEEGRDVDVWVSLYDSKDTKATLLEKVISVYDSKMTKADLLGLLAIELEAENVAEIKK